MKQSYYFIGIGGIGMSALARFLLSRGDVVGGYDRDQTDLCQALTNEGAQIGYDSKDFSFIDTFSSNLLVIYTAAVGSEHPQLKYALSKGVRTLKRAQFLGEIVQSGKVLAVAGTHGKTTTSTFLTHFLKQSNVSFTAFLGGISNDLNSNYYSSGSEYFVVEADEFDRSFLALNPHSSIVTSIEPDHLDIYKDYQAIVDSFTQFASQTSGTLMAHESVKLTGSISYGFSPENEWHITDVELTKSGTNFKIHSKDSSAISVRVPFYGNHNLLNALAAYMIAKEIVSFDKLIPIFNTLPLAKRRASKLVENNQVVFYDDYAHHPSEIKAMYQLLRSRYQNRSITAIFQPHLYSRTRDFANEFTEVLGLFDNVWILPIYPAREAPIEGVSSELLLNGDSRLELVSKEEVLSRLSVKSPEVLVTLGAGDIANLSKSIQKLLEQ